MKTLTLILLLFTTNLFGQTNYNTILNTKKDPIPPIDLHLKRYQRLEKTSDILGLASVITLTALYYIVPKSPAVFIAPSGLFLGSIVLSSCASNERKKSKTSFESE